MGWKENISNGWQNLFRKRRFNMTNATDDTEEWHIHISPASIFAGFTGFLLLLFIIVLSLVAYTPVMEFLPGYRTEADRARDNLAHSIIRLDSIERVMKDMMTYNENISLIMEGKSPVARTLESSDNERKSKVAVLPSPEDSLLRSQMEGDGIYSLSSRPNPADKLRKSLELLPPVEGIITDRFDIKAGRFSMKMATTEADRVTAIAQGTVILSLWSPQTGHIIEIQHSNNTLSVYKNLSQSLVEKGQLLKAGDLIGYSADHKDAEHKQLFEFELWNNGKPVDPEAYIIF